MRYLDLGVCTMSLTLDLEGHGHFCSAGSLFRFTCQNKLLERE